MIVSFKVELMKAVPQGSMQGFIRGGKVSMVPSNQKALKAWRKEVALAATLAYSGEALDQAVGITLKFHAPAPKSRNGKHWDDKGHDLDKLTRAVLDGLTGPLFKNDARVCRLYAEKVLEPTDAEPFTEITVWTLDE